ncbi:hypothetical protein MTR67_030939 [Solanum verrucosum]|uniref:Tf2-1-like SH3-like domain-containing protein n=1 Tax=Solanum verrucosum TaxID=315347 RepID=A0AAF0U1N4_SOLVR|nr:hypothetical protein MTR67_030939 [Solanum verrucosum]
MSILYHPGKANVVVDALSMLSLGSTTHVKEEKRELAKDVHRLALLGVRLMDSTKGGIVVMNGTDVMKLGKKGRLSPQYIRPYRISKRINNVAYELELPPELAAVHPVFHISNVKKCMGDT